MKDPGFLTSLKEELSSVDDAVSVRVHRPGGMTDNVLVSLATRVDSDPAMYHPGQASPKDIASFDSVSEDDERVGNELIGSGKVALAVLAGGAGTRMGAPKLFARIPGPNVSLLAWKLLQAGDMPVWVMTSPDMAKETQRHVSALTLPPGMRGVIFDQFEGYRLTPDNRLSLVAPGIPELHPLGHGDLGNALYTSGILADNPQVKHVIVCNVDNVLASPHPGVLGHHLRSGRKVTCEVVERDRSDSGGVLAWVDDRLQVVESFRLPDGFSDDAPYHNTNTMVIDVDVLERPVAWRWHRVRKVVNNRLVVQHERLLQQYTEEFETNFVCVPRDARYMPVKTHEQLAAAGAAVLQHEFRP